MTRSSCRAHPKRTRRKLFTALLKNAPLPDDELLPNLGLFLSSKSFSRLLFFYEMYQKIVHNHGVIVECGVRWGQTLSILSALRGSLEPYNRHRKIIGFDTFAASRVSAKKTASCARTRTAVFPFRRTTKITSRRFCQLQEALNPMSHLKRFELVKGDATETIPHYLKAHPETIVSLAIFDFDIYKPTKVALAALKPHLCKGSILVFDELCDDIFPGETVALQEVFRLEQVPHQTPADDRARFLHGDRVMPAMTPACREIRRNILNASRASGHGHIPTSFSIIEMLCAVYDTMKHDPKNPKWEERDIFILSKGHAALGFYAVLAQYGYLPGGRTENLWRVSIAARLSCRPLEGSRRGSFHRLARSRRGGGGRHGAGVQDRNNLPAAFSRSSATANPTKARSGNP